MSDSHDASGHDDPRQLLARGGSGVSADAAKYNGLVDPPGAERLGRELADRLAGRGLTALVIWEDPEDVVLGHVVGRELGLPVVRAYDADGLVAHSGGLPASPAVALVGDAVRDEHVVLAVSGMIGQAGGRLVATAVLVETPQLRAVHDRAGDIVAIEHAPDEDADAAGVDGLRIARAVGGE